MSLIALGMAVLASLILWLAGFWFASARAGRERQDLEARHDAAQERLRRLERERSPSNVDARVLKAELASAVRPLLERDVQAHQVMESQLQTLLRPLLDRERMGTALVGLSAGMEQAQSLMDLLDAIARSGNFITVLISDEVGLPLASNTSGVDPDVQAGMASMLLTLFDRIESNGQPCPLAAVFRDEANRLILHRVFRVQGARFVLTAVSLGMPVSPEALDPALVSIERMLNRQAWGALEGA